MKNWYLLLAAVAAIFMSSCGKATVDSETSRWKSTQQLLDKLSGEYPGFKTALMQTKDAAAAQMKTAEAVSGDEAKIKAMSEANNAAKPQFVRDLETLKPNMEKLKNLMVEVPKKVTTDADKTSAALAVREADFTIGTVTSKLNSAAPANASEANGLTASLVSEVDAATKRLSSLIKDAEKTTAANKTAADSSKKVEEKKLADIKCRSCGKMQPAGSKKCGDCTAPLD
jgi:DNA repair exonuclease SbcCD ATPase subunit